MRLGLYHTIWQLVRVLGRLLYRIEIVGRIPPGACIVAANHESVLDPPLLALATKRPLRFLGKEQLWRYRPGGWLMDALGAVRVSRGREGSVTIDRAEELVRRGELVAIFPQGTVQGGEWRLGAARLALSTGLPLVPVRIVGTARALSRRRIGLPRVRIVVGEPIPVEPAPPTDAAARELTAILQQRVESL